MPHRARALKLQRTRPRTIDGRAALAFESGSASLAEVLRTTPEHLALIRERGLGLLRAGNPIECRKLFEMLDVLGDRGAVNDFVLAYSCDQMGDRDAARSYFNRGLEIATALEQTDLKQHALRWGAHLATERA